MPKRKKFYEILKRKKEDIIRNGGYERDPFVPPKGKGDSAFFGAKIFALKHFPESHDETGTRSVRLGLASRVTA